MAGHPDQRLVNSIISGFEIGFDIGFKGKLTNTFPKNNKSAFVHKQGVTEAVCKEIARGHTAGPFATPPFPINHISPLGAVPKPDGSIRLIMDLSQPKGESINDFISKEEFPCKYTPFDEATRLVRQSGKGSFLTKIDIKHAYRLLPVRPEDWPLLVYHWEGHYCVDLKLPFGGRSSASIFTDFADLVCWIINNRYDLVVIHYSDDYLLISLAILTLAVNQKETMLAVFRYLNIPVADDKLIGPATSLPYLGIEIDTVSMRTAVPKDKLEATLHLLPKWQGRRTATKQQLLSLIGKLQNISLVVRPGRLFLRRLIDLSCTVKELNHHINLNTEARKDTYNGGVIGFLLGTRPRSSPRLSPSLVLTYACSPTPLGLGLGQYIEQTGSKQNGTKYAPVRTWTSRSCSPSWLQPTHGVINGRASASFSLPTTYQSPRCGKKGPRRPLTS